MGWIARSQLASAVSQAGACGIIETSSGELDAVKDEIRQMRDLTDKPFGVNIAQAFVRDPNIAEFVIDQGVKFVTTSAGSPTKYTERAQGRRADRVPRRADAERRAQGGRRRRRRARRRGRRGRRVQEPDAVSTMVLLPLVRSQVDVPIIAAGGIVDGATMAAAFALGAEGVQMGTRMVSAAESPVHDNWKQAIVDAAETDTVFLNRPPLPGPAGAAHRAHRRRSQHAEHNVFGEFGDAQDALLRRRHGGGDRARRPGRRAASTRCGRSPTSSPTPSASSARRSTACSTGGASHDRHATRPSCGSATAASARSRSTVPSSSTA